MRRVLIANRGEVAVRIARACRDLGIDSVGIYTEDDRHSLHASTVDEAYLLDGPARVAYLDIEAVLEAARRARVDAVHPGYGFLAESAEFAKAVLDAGLIWVGPPPSAIRLLGDKISARTVARAAGAPVVAGTSSAVDEREALAFARKHGLPIAFKAAFGGGGRGLRVARTLDEIPEQFEAATREAALAFGRPDCFVERYLDEVRHVETQCLADSRGAVAVISTRDCSVQRRHQKLIEEAPAPFLTEEQHRRLVTASEAILASAKYVGAGTCEFLLARDGTLSFLEVNTRLQVEHPVTEEVTGVDLVCEQLRIAAGEPLASTYPAPRGHAIEFRINAEDAGRGFVPTPGPVTVWVPPSGPGVRVDSGVTAGSVISEHYDSMLAKLVVRGADRDQALRRAARALAEFRVEGLTTVLPFHRATVKHPDFAPADPQQPFAVHTRWIETVLAGQIPPHPPVAAAEPAMADAAEQADRRRIVLEVNGRRVEVVAPLDVGRVGAGRAARRIGRTRPAPAATRARLAPSGTALTSPMQGTVVRVAATDGQMVAAGDLIVVLEAMKMEQPVFAHRAGTVTDLAARLGESLAPGALICHIHAEPA